MKKFFSCALFLIGAMLPSRALAQQPIIQANFDATSPRRTLELPLGTSRLRVYGLEPGQRYLLICNPATSDQPAHFRISALDSIPTETWPNRPQRIGFEAVGKTADFQVVAETKEMATTVPMSLSMSCTSCPKDDSWLQGFAEANLSCTGGIAASSLITNTLIGGNCFDVTNITSAGNTNSRGTFTNGATNIGINNGVILCTGNVTTMPGPNNANNSGNGSFNNNSPDDTDLATLTNTNQYDVSKIEFDFTPTAPQVTFDFVFGSEEYCEFVNSSYNDVFGFFISGPGITGNQNIALIPSTSIPVAINNVNHLTNSAYYVNNNNFPQQGSMPHCSNLPVYNAPECQLDGWTTNFTATANVTPCSTYHIKLAIADVGDAIYSSAVFLKANSFDAGGGVKAEPVYPVAGSQFVFEGCSGGFIKFTRSSGDINLPLEVNFTIAGSSTATPGDDYAPLVSPIIIPAGQMMVQIPITVFADLIVEGDETITILLDNPCSCTQQPVTFIIKDKPPLVADLNDVTTCGGTSAVLNPMPAGGQTPYTYMWSTNATTSTITVTTIGSNTYTVTVTDGCGGTTTAEAMVNLLPKPTANISGSGILCEGVPGQVNLNVTMTGEGPWDLTWALNGSQTTETFNTSPGVITATEPGTYTLVGVSSANGCTGTVTGNVNIQEVNVNINLTPTNPTCFGVNNGSISSSVSGGTAPYTYQWSPSGSGANPNNLAPGTYNVTVTSSQGCTEDAEVTIESPPLLEAAVTNSSNIDCNNPIGNAALDVSGGTPGYNYNWTGGSGGANPNFTAGGTYTVTVTDSKGCTKTASVTITANTVLPVAVIAPPQQINCNNVNLTLNANGSSQGSDFTYQWGGPSFVCCETTLEPQIDQGGTYIITVTNTVNGCTKTASVSVVQNNTPPNAVATTPGSIGCNTPTISISGAGSSTGAGISYQWGTSDGNIVSGATTLNPSVNLAGTYTITVTNANTGCTNTASVTVTGNTELPIATIAPPGIVDCYTPNIDLDASGSSQGNEFTYNWATNGGSINSGGNTTTPEVDEGGTYTITVTNTSNNCTATAVVVVPENQTQPTAVATTPGPITCNNPVISVSGVGSSTGSNFTYEWGTSNGSIVGGETTLNPQVNEAGTYIITVTNTTNGCTKTASVNVVENNTPPNAVATTPGSIGCTTPTITISGVGSSTGAGFTYQWGTSDGNIVSGATTLNPSVNLAGTYTITVTNGNTGCTNEASVTVTGNTDLPTAVIAPPGIVDCYTPEINLDASGSSQGNEFTYVWATNGGSINSGGNTTNPEVDEGGTYTITVTNTSNNCTATAVVVVPENLTQPVAVATTPGSITCQNPVITISGVGSSSGGNFTYEWGTPNGNIVSGEYTLSPQVNQGGIYIITVTNTTNGCTKTASVNVSEDGNIPNADAGPDKVLNCYTPTVQLNGAASSGPGLSFQWSANPGTFQSGQSTLSPTVNSPGVYTIVVTNSTNGCTSEDVVEVSSNFDTPDAQIAPPDIITCYTPEIDLDGSISTGNGIFSYNWSTSNGSINGSTTNETATVDAPGTYTLVVTNVESGCTDLMQVTVTQNTTPPIAQAGNTVHLTCQNPVATLNGVGSSTGGNMEYEWGTNIGNILDGQFTLSPTIDQAGIYYLTVTNTTNGCTSTDFVNVTADQNFPVASGGPDLELNCQTPIATINGMGSSAGNGITYQWTANPGNIVSGGTTRTPKVDEAGIYTLVLTNSTNGCTATDEVEVWDNIIYPEPSIAPPQQLNCAFTEVDIDATASVTTTSNANFTWTTPNGNIVSGNGTPVISVNDPGTYNLVVANIDNYCTATATVTVTQNIAIPLATTQPNASITCQFPQLELNGQGSSSGPEFFYNWTTSNGNILSGELTLNPIVNQPGTYVLTVQNLDNQCESTATVLVQSGQAFPNASAGNGQNLTCAIDEIILNGSQSSQGSQYAYAWSTQTGNIVSGANTLTPLVDAPGTYDINVVNLQNGCVSTSSVVIGTDYVLPVAVVAPGGVLSCTVTSLSLSGTGSSTGNPFTYLWTTTNGNILSGETTLSPLVNGVGTYNLLVTNSSNGCTQVAATTVQADASLPVAVAGAPDTLTCAVLQSTLNGTASNQGSQYAYAWTGPGILSGGTTLQPVVNKPGEYILTVTNTTNGCKAVSAVNIAQDIQNPTAVVASSPELTCKTTVLDLDASNSSTGSLFSYVWTTSNGGNITAGPNTLTPTINQPGTYSLLISNAFNACTATAQIAITQDIALPQADAGPTGLITCTNATVPLSGTGSTGPIFEYEWTTPNGNIASGANALQAVADAPGNYQLLVTNTYNGCTATDNTTVTKDANVPTALAEVGGELNCVTDSIQLNGLNSTQGSTLTYVWQTTNGNILSGANTLTPMVNQPGQYTLRVFNTANNCLAISTVNVALNLVPPDADAGIPAVISCQNPILTLDGTGSSTGPSYSYLWNTLNGNILGSPTVLNPQVDESGFYTIVVTDASNGCTASNTVQIILDQNTPEAEAGASPTLTCAVTALNLNGTASSTGNQFTYLWTTQDGNIVSGANGLTPNVNQPGTYNLLVSNLSNGCTSEDEVTVQQNITAPTALAGSSPTLTCTTQSTALSGVGSSAGSNFAYNWTTANGQILSGANTIAPTIGDPGLYQLLVTNITTGCTATATVQAFEDVVPPLSAANTPAELTCLTLSLNLSGTGSSTGNNFAYQWTTTNGNVLSGGNSLSPLVDEPGTYKIRVTNTVNGCTTEASTTVTQNVAHPQVNALVNSILTCAVTELNLNGIAVGGSQGVSLLWTGPGIVSGNTTNAPTIDAVGNYVLVATDNYNGCVSTDSVLVSNDVTAPTLTIAQPATLTCFLKETPISGAGSSIGGQFTYEWTGPGILTGGQTLQPIVNLPGTYALTITNNSNGCTSTGSTAVAQDVLLPLAAAGGAFELTCSIEQGQLNSTGSSTGNSIRYTWNTTPGGNIVSGATSAMPVVNQAGTYFLTVSDIVTGCTSTASVAVTRNTNYPSEIDFSTENPKCDEQPGEVIFEEIIGGTPPYTYSIDGGVTFGPANQFNTIQPGLYTLYVRDANGCLYKETLSFPVPPEPAVTLSPSVTIAFGANTEITATVLNIPLSEVDTVIWSPMTGITLTNKPNVVIAEPYTDTEYKVTIISEDGCEATATVLVEVADPKIWAPNVFSPGNQDGENDWFYIFSAPNTVKKIHSLQVFDRWGDMLFQNKDIQPNDYKFGWDGRFRGSPMTPAVFVWWAKVELVDGREILMKGDVTIAD